jgi:hypothetical protein
MTAEDVVRLVALVRLAASVQRVNAAHGVVTTPAGGYHETITHFYMQVICEYVAVTGNESEIDWAARVNRLLARYGARDLPLRPTAKTC